MSELIPFYLPLMFFSVYFAPEMFFHYFEDKMEDSNSWYAFYFAACLFLGVTLIALFWKWVKFVKS